MFNTNPKHLSLYNCLSSKTQQEVVNTLSTISQSVTSLDLSGNCFSARTGVELATAFRCIPSNIKKLNLADNDFYRLTSDELGIALRGIPNTATSLSFCGDQLGKKSDADFIDFFAALPRGIKSISLAMNNLELKNGKVLAAAFAKMPATVTSLDLSYNSLFKNTAKELFACISENITSLNLSFNNLGNRSDSELFTIFQNIPKGITLLDLEGSNFFKQNGPRIESTEVFKGIPKHVNSMGLSLGDVPNKKNRKALEKTFALIPENITAINFGGYFSPESVTAFKSIPQNVTSIGFRNLSIFFTDGTDYKFRDLFEAIPPHITSIAFGRSALSYRAEPSRSNLFLLSLTDIFNMIPQSVTSLNLSNNDLFEMNHNTISASLKAIPATITLLNLSNNNLGEKNNDELASIFKAIPTGVNIVNLSENGFYKKPLNELRGIFEHFFTKNTFVNLGIEDLKEISKKLNSDEDRKTFIKFMIKLAYSINPRDITCDNNLLAEEIQKALNACSPEVPNNLSRNDLLKFPSLISIREIHFSSSHINDSIVKNSLSALIKSLPMLEDLNLQDNKITFDGAHYLAWALKGIKNLKYLNLNNNFIEAEESNFKRLQTTFSEGISKPIIFINQNLIGNLETSGPKFRKRSNSDYYELGFFRTQAHSTVSLLDKNVQINPNEWRVSLCCSKIHQHSTIFLEGMNENGQRFLERYEISTDGFVIIGQGTVNKNNQSFFNAEKYYKQVKSISRMDGELLRCKVLDGKKINYSIYPTSFTKRDNCLTWALKKLDEVGVIMDRSFFNIPSLNFKQ